MIWESVPRLSDSTRERTNLSLWGGGATGGAFAGEGVQAAATMIMGVNLSKRREGRSDRCTEPWARCRNQLSGHGGIICERVRMRGNVKVRVTARVRGDEVRLDLR